MNKGILMGRLTKAPEIKYLQDDNKTAMARYTLAVDRRYGKDREREADFIPCVTFGKNAEFFLLAERIFSDPVLCDAIAKMVVGRRDRIEAGEAELQSTIEDLKEAGYWKSGRKE